MLNNFYGSFYNTSKTINIIVANGKRFMAYDIASLLNEHNQKNILQQLQGWINNTQKSANKQHEVFEPSFDGNLTGGRQGMQNRKVYYSEIKLYAQQSMCCGICSSPQEYEHSSARFYITGMQSVYPVTGLWNYRILI